jgi:carbon-monoxide dehydrogenase large subunit
MAISRALGARVRRREDPRLITGTGTYVDDVRDAKALTLRFVRSTQAHALLTAISTEAARAAPGVVAVITAKDLEGVGALPLSGPPGTKVPKRFPLTADRVRYFGDPFAAVVAETAAQAEDAATLVEVEYSPLPAVVDPLSSAEARGASVLHEEMGDNIALRRTLGGGDVQVAFAKADVVIRQRLINQRVAAVTVEPRAVLAQWSPWDQELTVWSSTQVPHRIRTSLALLLRLPESQVRVIAPEVGGGFGMKGSVITLEEVMVAFAAVRLGRPVRWTEERSEQFAAAPHGRGHVHDAELAATREGKILAVRTTMYNDLGAYSGQAGLSGFTAQLLPGCYAIPAATSDIVAVYTNKAPLSIYRGAGRPEALYTIERLVDLLARELQLDPAEVRRRNFIPADRFPYANPVGLHYDSGNYQGVLDRALELANYKDLRRRQQELRLTGRYLGIGVASYIEIAGVGPSKLMGSGTWESGSVRVLPTGKVVGITGTAPQGQGHETAWAQILGDELGVPSDAISIRHGDTGLSPMGVGTFGSRSAALGGSALLLSARQVRAKAVKIAAALLEAAEEDVAYEAGAAHVRGTPSRQVTLADIARAAYAATRLPAGMEAGLEATTFFDPPNYVFPFGAQVAVVEVDVDTGFVRLQRFISVDDCGNVINPMLVDGQVQGGITQGAAQALWEEVVYDQEGQLLTGNLATYAAPTALEVPMFETDRTVTPTDVNPLGAKGVGELATVGAAATVVNAVMDALTPFGIKHLDMPLTPAKLWEAIQAATPRLS